MIVKLAVEQDDGSLDNLDPHCEKNATELCSKVKQPAITRTCKAIREEALRLFYTHNTFTFQDTRCLTFDGMLEWTKGTSGSTSTFTFIKLRVAADRF